MTTHERVLAYKDSIIKTLAGLVSYNTENKEATENAPFGKENVFCLNAALEHCKAHGMKAVNLDNYCGYGEIGEGEKVVGIVGHLDVVPAGEGWATDPFALTEINGNLYGRGTTDDKGAIVSNLFALQILQDEGYDFNGKRVRLIMGCNEESGSLCMKHYVEKEGYFDYGYTPDASFPGIFGEKGSIGGVFSSTETRIISMNGGTAPNAVCNKCITHLPLDFCDWELLRDYLRETRLEYKIINNNSFVELTVFGTAAHASTPELGVNAISHTFKALEYANCKDRFVDEYCSLIGLSTDGSLCNIKAGDPYGDLTFNNGMIFTKDGVISGTIDIRCPITIDSNEMAERMKKAFEEKGCRLDRVYSGKPLYFDPNCDMVQALVKAYAKLTGDTISQPECIGGGTYAKTMHNCIGFGPEFAKEDCHIHDVNEYVSIEHLLLQVEIYHDAIKNLCELD